MGELIILVWHSVALGFKLMSSTIPVAYRQLKRVVPPGRMSSLTSIPEALLCVGLSTCVFACELIELTELSENCVGDGPFFSWWVFLVAHSTNCVGERDCTQLPPSNLLSWCKFSFDFITLHQFDPISYSLYFSNISNQ